MTNDPLTIHGHSHIRRFLSVSLNVLRVATGNVVEIYIKRAHNTPDEVLDTTLNINKE